MLRLGLSFGTLVPASSHHSVTSLQHPSRGCVFPLWASEALLQGQRPQLVPGSHLLGTRSLTGLPEHDWLETPPCPRKAAPTLKPPLPHLPPLATDLLSNPLGTRMSQSPTSAAHPSQPRPKPPGAPLLSWDQETGWSLPPHERNGTDEAVCRATIETQMQRMDI